MTAAHQMERLWVVLSAAVLELPLMVVCIWIALHTEHLIDGRLEMHVNRSHAPRATSTAGERRRN